MNNEKRRFPRWPIFIIAAPAAIAIWSGWVGLGAMCGFGVVHPLPGIVPGFKLNTAITLPVGVEAYGGYALAAWLRGNLPAEVRKFAKVSAFSAFFLGVLGQVAYHLLDASGVTRAPVPVIILVSCLPVVALALGTALAHLLPDGSAVPGRAPVPGPEPVPAAAPVPARATVPVPGLVPAPVLVPAAAPVPPAVSSGAAAPAVPAPPAEKAITGGPGARTAGRRAQPGRGRGSAGPWLPGRIDRRGVHDLNALFAAIRKAAAQFEEKNSRAITGELMGKVLECRKGEAIDLMRQAGVPLKRKTRAVGQAQDEAAGG